MAIIDQKTGYYGFTLDGTGGTPIDENGQVNRCIISIVYPVQVNDVDFTISNGADDWAVKMGDGSIIPLTNPSVLFVNRDCAIVQFDMTESYPSNSPCILVYHSDTAMFNIKQRTTNRPFEANAVSGHFAFTTEGYDNTQNENDYANYLIATIPFPYMNCSIKFTITDDPNHWGARMGDGSIISLSEPEIMATNEDNAVVRFKMEKPYPSNSPCILLYKDINASFNIEYVEESLIFTPISEIINVPSEAISGQVIDLNVARVMPFNASDQKINWSIVNGSGKIEDGFLYTTKGGLITIKATAVNGLDWGSPYTETFKINVTQNEITLSDITPSINSAFGKVNNKISVNANSLTSQLSYQWYVNNENSYDNATAIESATESSFVIPSDINKGDYYYFCKVSSDGANPVYTNICYTHIFIECTGIEIIPRLTNIAIDHSYQLNVKPIPEDAELGKIVWESSSSDVIKVDQTGKITSNLLSESVTITAKTLDGSLTDFLEITVDEYHSVTDIVLSSTEFNADTEYELSANVYPNNASYTDITWSIIDDGETGAIITDNKIKSVNPGIAKICATIERGSTYMTAYKKEFYISFIENFVPVESIKLKDISTSKTYNIDEVVSLECIVTPSNATNQNITFSLVSGPGNLNENLLSFNGAGDVKVKCIIEDGILEGSDFTSTFIFKCSGLETDKELEDSFIPVTNVVVEFTHTSDDGTTTVDEYYDPFGADNNPMVLPSRVIPEIATNQDMTVSVTKIISKIKPEDIINGTTNIIPDEFWDITDWETEDLSLISYDNDTKHISCDVSKIRVSRYYQITLHFNIPKGKSESEAFEKDVIIKISSETVLPFIPLEDLNIILPSKLRVYYPILVSNFEFEPTNATIKYESDRSDKTFYFPEIPDSEEECGVLVFDPEEYDLYHTVVPLDIFEWNRKFLYLYPYNPGKITLRVVVDMATVTDLENYNRFYPEKTYFEKYFEYDVLPPFIPVKNIKNIPTQLPSNSRIILSPEICTENGLDCYNPCWDEEVATNTNIIWSINNGDGYDSTGVTISEDGIITIDANRRSGKFSIKATIPEGVAEYLEWYGKEQEAVDYVQTFEIEVVAEEENFDRSLLTITLTDNSKIDVYKYSEFRNLCNDKSSDFTINIGNRSFKKSQIKEIKFWDDAQYIPPETDTSISVMDITGIPTEATSYDTIDLEDITITPSNATNQNIVWSVETIGSNDSHEIVDNKELIINGNDSFAILSATIENGIGWHNQNFVKHFLISVGNPSDKGEKIVGIDITPNNKEVYAGKEDNIITIDTGLITDITNSDEIDELYQNITWELDGDYAEGTEIFVADDSKSATITIDPDEEAGTNIFVKVTLNVNSDEFTQTAVINIIEEPPGTYEPTPEITSLCDFGRNFINLRKIDRIPPTITGNDCLKNFLRGCTSFNQEIVIPDDVNGERCLKYFMRDCITFNSSISIPDGITGESCMHGFLYGCSTFNQPITIPDTVTGKSCLERFLYGCSTFNQPITIPSIVSGYACLRSFMGRCLAFNQALTLPDDVGEFKDENGYNCGRQMNCMLEGIRDMCSTITVPTQTGINAEMSERSFSSFIYDSDYVQMGITVNGPGAEKLLERLDNSYEEDENGYKGFPPYVHITNLD